jgi:hypothetical protein
VKTPCSAVREAMTIEQGLEGQMAVRGVDDSSPRKDEGAEVGWTWGREVVRASALSVPSTPYHQSGGARTTVGASDGTSNTPH